mgnify:FL=1
MKTIRSSTIAIKITLLIFLSVMTTKSQELEILGYWDFNDPSDPAASSDVTGSSPDLEFIGGTAYTDDGDGFSDSVGDYALDLGGVNDGSLAQTLEGDHLNTAYDNNAMSVVFWQNTTQTGNTSSFWIHSPAAGSNERGFQAHTPWGNGTIYFDQSGCCGATQRLTVGGLVQLNQWQHFVFQRDADGNMEIWVDGVQAASQGGAEPLDEFNGIISVGAEGPSQANSMAGRIDDFAIFNNVLDEDQIATLAGGSSPLELIDTSDDDEDGLPDLWEEKLVDNLEDLNGNAGGPGPGSGTGDFDGDGLTDLDEYEETKTDPTKADTDGDGLSDGVETNTGSFVSATNTGTNPKNADTDGDGLADSVETNTGELVDEESTGTDPNNADSDGDGYSDGYEVAGGSDPNDENSKGSIPSPILYVDFEDGAVDSSEQGNDGDVSGAITFDAEGAEGGSTPFAAGNFNGGYINFPGVDLSGIIQDIEGENSYTLSAWIKPSDLNGNKFLWGQTQQGIHNGIRNGGFLHQAHWGADTNGATNLGALDGEWIHAAWVYDGDADVGTIYLNGEVDWTGGKRAPNGSGNLIVGGSNGGGDNYRGLVDDVAVWNEALPQGSIRALVDGASPIGRTDEDQDGDGLPDFYEEKFADNLEDLNGNASGPGPGAGTGDFDGDGLTDLDEYEETKTDPTKADTDDDGLSDGVETNTGTYVSATNTGTDPKKADTDRDGLADGVETNTGELVDEENTGTDPNNSDTDGDGYADGGEIIGGTDPNDENSKGVLPFPYLYLDFEGEVADLSGNGNDGVVDGDVTFDVDGADLGPTPTTGASFNGGHLDFPSIDMNSMIRDFEDGSYTFACWMKPIGSAGGQGFMWGQTQQGIHNGIRNGGLLHSAHWGADWNASTVLEADQWVHAVWTYDGAIDEATIYLNGQVDGGPTAQRAPNGGGTFIFGGRNNGEIPYNGHVDDIAIWREVLPESAIEALADGVSPIGATQEDDDGDGLPDAWEEKYGVDDPEGDDDNDGLTNIEEFEARTKPDKADSDNDGLNDKVEITDTKTNPLNADSDKDGLLDGVESNTGIFVNLNNTGTDPLNADSDGDGYSDSKEVIDSLSDPNNPNSTPPVPELKLLAYWDFNDPSDPTTAADVSGNAPSAELLGSASYSEDGDGYSGAVGDYALDLGTVNDQSSAVTPEGDHFSEPFDTNELSVAFWQNTTAVGNTSAFWMVAPNATGSQRGFQAHTPWGNGTIYFDQSGCCGGTQRLTVGGLVNTDTWQHFVFQRNEEGTMEIWVDGQLAASKEGAEPLDEFNGVINIGSDLNQGNSLAGRIDEFAIFNKPLDEVQIQTLFEGSIASELIAPAAPFAITSVVRNADGNIEITFNARPNVVYAVDASEDCEIWQEIDDNVLGSKGVGTFTDISGFAESRQLFYRVRKLDE